MENSDNERQLEGSNSRGLVKVKTLVLWNASVSFPVAESKYLSRRNLVGLMVGGTAHDGGEGMEVRAALSSGGRSCVFIYQRVRKWRRDRKRGQLCTRRSSPQ